MNAAGTSFYRTLPPGGFPPPKAPTGARSTPLYCFLSPLNVAYKMNYL